MARKTTMLRLRLRADAANLGTVRVLAQIRFSAHRTAATTIGYLPQRFSLYGDCPSTRTSSSSRGSTVRRSLPTAAHACWISPASRRFAAGWLSGLRRHETEARARLHARARTAVLVLDEPTTGVDPVSRREFWKLLAEFLAQGLTILLATPYWMRPSAATVWPCSMRPAARTR
jgi:ABC-2 type transport system ATP-binding protein